MEASDYWLDQVSTTVNKTSDEISTIWSDYGIKTPYDYAKLGLISGVRYYDQVEEMIQLTYRDRRVSFIQNIVNYWRNVTGIIPDTPDTTTTATADSTTDSSSNMSTTTTSSVPINAKLSFDTMMEMELKARNIDFNLSQVTLIRRIYTQPTKDLSNITSTASTTTTTEATSTTISTSETESSSIEMDKKQKLIQEKAAKFYEVYKFKKERSLASFFPAGLYLRKMRKGYKLLSGLPIREVYSGKRIGKFILHL